MSSRCAAMCSKARRSRRIRYGRPTTNGFTTQIFFAGDPQLHSDAIFSVTDDLTVDPKMDRSGQRGSFEFDIALVPEAG